ncbi:MAG: GGDEF domain-containing protein [Alphaproteobacteria bacterium]|nr:GGDEF domain-containing protein [Alphaproteobacteria bacterium]
MTDYPEWGSTVHYHHDSKQAQEFSNNALERIRSEALPATPDVYELWYVYFSGQSPEVTRAIDILIANKQRVTLERCHELYTRFISDEKNQEAVRRAGDEINSTIRNVTGVVRDVKAATAEYSGNLEGVTAKIQSSSSPQELQQVLASVVSDTKNMLERNKTLEEELNKSSHVMEELQRDLESVRREALTDGLTNLSNRKAFDNELSRISEEARQTGGTFCLLMVDIDYFKSFNDNYGHQVGDQVLRLVARTLTDGVKGRDIAARYGGEEFAIILPDTNLAAAVIVGNALRKAVATKDVVNRSTGDKLGRITMSVGCAEYDPGENLQDLIERADAALYTAKHNGRNQVAAAPTPGKKQKKELA